jgi:hypothetical protein
MARDTGAGQRRPPLVEQPLGPANADLSRHQRRVLMATVQV